MYLVFTHMPGETESYCRRLYLWCSVCTLYLLACQVRVTTGNSVLCYVCVMLVCSLSHCYVKSDQKMNVKSKEHFKTKSVFWVCISVSLWLTGRYLLTYSVSSTGWGKNVL